MSNSFFNASGAPATRAQLLSASIRSEFAQVSAGFDKLPALAGNALKVLRVNAGGTAIEAVADTSSGTYVAKAGDTMSGALTVNAAVSASGVGGFKSTTYVVNARNPIWRFGNSDNTGLSYFQGSAGIGGDTIGLHFVTATAAGSQYQFNQSAAAVFLNTLITPQFSTQVTGSGFATLQRGDGTRTGYTEFWSAGGVRQGYIGYSSSTGTIDTGTINFVMGTAAFNGAITAPSFTGSGAGLTGLAWTNITGKPTFDTNASASTVAQRDAAGYLFAAYLNQSSANNENPTISQVLVTNGSDNFLRKSSISALNAVVAPTWANVSGKPTRTDWSTIGSVANVVGQLSWKNYSNNHTIFDASAGTSPTGAAISNVNATNAWIATYPTLMGYNGTDTYGVRVDSARTADIAAAATAASATTLNSGRTDVAAYPVLWGPNGSTSPLFSCNAVTIQSSSGTLTATTFVGGAVTQAASDNSTNIATTAFVKAQGTSPAGMVSMFAMSTAPTGWLECNGAAVSRATYSTLFAAISTQFGVGDGSTTFNLPDLRGEFMRGWDHGRGVDSGRGFGTSQSSANLAHTHTISTNFGNAIASGNTLSAGGGLVAGGSGSTFGANDSSGGTEARPRNIALLVCIKT